MIYVWLKKVKYYHWGILIVVAKIAFIKLRVNNLVNRAS